MGKSDLNFLKVFINKKPFAITLVLSLFWYNYIKQLLDKHREDIYMFSKTFRFITIALPFFSTIAIFSAQTNVQEIAITLDLISKKAFYLGASMHKQKCEEYGIRVCINEPFLKVLHNDTEVSFFPLSHLKNRKNDDILALCQCLKNPSITKKFIYHETENLSAQHIIECMNVFRVKPEIMVLGPVEIDKLVQEGVIIRKFPIGVAHGWAGYYKPN